MIIVYREGNEIVEVRRIEDVPEVFDHLILYKPDFPPEPHSPEDHDRIAQFNDELQMLMRRERNASRDSHR